MNTEQTATFLRTVPLFHQLPDEHFHRLAQTVRSIKLAAGQLVEEVYEGEPALFIIVEGECLEYTEQGGLGMEVQTRRFYPGDFFNAETVIEEQPAPCRVKSLMPGRAMVVPKGEVDRLLAASPEFARTLCRIFALRVKQSLGAVSGIRFVHLKDFNNLESLSQLVPRKLLSISRSVVVEQNGDRVTVAMVNPSDLRARSFLQDVLRDYHVQFTAISEEDFEKYGRKLLGERIELSPADVPFESLVYQNSEGVVRPLSGSREDDLLARLLSMAVRRLASDVHFEPYHGQARVRLRVDGRMIVIDEHIPAVSYRHMAARIKVLAELDTTRIRRPQDGRFLLRVDDHPIEFRVSASPCHGGEKIVLRIVAPSKQYSDLSRLILNPPYERTAMEMFRSPSGLVLVTGPSGAGKTTTLYAALSSVVASDGTKNIITIEDPVEYDLPFATQIQVNRETGMDFASILKSVLRQDPDVILVGEIRDPESAAMAAEAATTGHLVLSSLHTYSALQAVVRLRDLRVPPYLIAAGLRGVVTQQLLPRLAPGYTQDVPLDDPSVRQLVELGVLNEQWSKPLSRGQDSAEGPLGGERGRVAIYEMLSVTPSLRTAVEHSTSLGDMEKCLDAQCFGSFVDYARFLLEQGIVAPERVTGVVPRALGWDSNRGICESDPSRPHSMVASGSSSQEVDETDAADGSTPEFVDVDSRAE